MNSITWDVTQITAAALIPVAVVVLAAALALRSTPVRAFGFACGLGGVTGGMPLAARDHAWLLAGTSVVLAAACLWGLHETRRAVTRRAAGLPPRCACPAAPGLHVHAPSGPAAS